MFTNLNVPTIILELSSLHVLEDETDLEVICGVLAMLKNILIHIYKKNTFLIPCMTLSPVQFRYCYGGILISLATSSWRTPFVDTYTYR